MLLCVHVWCDARACVPLWFKRLARASVAAASWGIRDFDALTVCCAEVLEYQSGSATGLGWHWNLGSTVTMVAMLHTSNTSVTHNFLNNTPVFQHSNP